MSGRGGILTMGSDWFIGGWFTLILLLGREKKGGRVDDLVFRKDFSEINCRDGLENFIC